MDGKFTDEDFDKADVAGKFRLLYGASKFQREQIRKCFASFRRFKSKTVKAGAQLTQDFSFIKGSNYVLVIVVVALIGTAIYLNKT